MFSKIRETIDGQASRDIMDVWLFHYDSEKSPLEELKNKYCNYLSHKFLCRPVLAQQVNILFLTVAAEHPRNISMNSSFTENCIGRKEADGRNNKKSDCGDYNRRYGNRWRGYWQI